ncbi:MAG: DNA helicase RecQ [Ruminococcus sp.]|nr:DNA helicase RecQ [Ruminococcus sp.]
MKEGIQVDKFSILKEYFGHDSFRKGQEELIDNILGGRDVLGIMPTGAGKSVCYQIPAVLMDGLTIVISPLISLMKDQVSALNSAGINAVCINSSLSAEEYRYAFSALYNGMCKILYIAPERLDAPEFVSFASNTKIAMVTVDEAHCVSQWGQDFRSSYLRIAGFIAGLPDRPVVSAFTATATNEVQKDIISLLELNEPFTVTTGYDRSNLFFSVQHPDNKYKALVKLLEGYSGKSGIVYCLSRKNVESVCEKLCNDGYSASRYHAGLPDSERRQNQEDFIFDRKQIMVATNAFGMGIDKSNVSFVIHYNMPKDPESYYQEAGRAGRDGEPAECTLLYSASDVRTNRFMIENSREENEELSDSDRKAMLEKDLERLKQMTFYCTTTDCLRGFMLKYFGEKPSNFCGKCSNCTDGFETVDITIDSQKILSCIYRVHQASGRDYGKVMITEILRGSKNEKLLNLGFDKLSTYGIMAETTPKKLRSELDYLAEYGYISVTEGDYPQVRLTAKSAEILRDKKQLTMKLPKEKKPAAKKAAAVGTDDFLFMELKRLRSAIASKELVPAYIVFSDSALRDMCRIKPTTIPQFMKVAGVGKVKAEKYGEQFCKRIAEYLLENPQQNS